MTLDAIRARDAEDMDLRYAIPWATALRVDVRALLAEVDRLTAEVVVEVQEVADTIPIACRAAVKNERACIAAEVRGLPVFAGTEHVDRAAVLAVVEGEA